LRKKCIKFFFLLKEILKHLLNRKKFISSIINSKANIIIDIIKKYKDYNNYRIIYKKKNRKI
jgi:hypothetical protein